MPVERRLITAMFCDLVGSTALAERLDPEVVRAVLDGYSTLAREAIERNGGTVAPFQGDGALGIFGLPTAHEDDSARAAQAGLDLLSALPSVPEAAGQGIALQARVGIEAGEVVGDLAIAARGALGGDALNTAARLQAVAEPGTVVAGPTARKLLLDRAELRPLPPLELKGKAEPVEAAVVLSVDARPRRPSASPFIGRERHLGSLVRAFEEAVADGAPVLATVLGDPGIGKSRLVDAFLGGLRGATVLRTAVPAAGLGASLAPIADLVLEAAGGGEPADAATRLGALLVGRADAVALESALRSLLGLGDQSGVEHAWAVRRLLETLATREPVVVALDDLHWASPALIDLIEDAARWTRAPVLLLCAARLDLLDARRSWGGGMQRALTITVGPLEEDESRSLADALLGPASEQAERLIATAEGNPLFLEQLAAEARELGETWDESIAPTTIRALLEARLDRCSPAVARALGVASVQGSRFRLDLVWALVPEGTDTSEVLRQAERAHLAAEVEPGVGAFTHALVRETAYRRLPKATRANLHAAIAGLLPEDEEELAGVHLERAAELRAELGHPDAELERLAGEALARTGARAFARLDLVTSSDVLGRAVRLLPLDSHTRLDVLPDLAVALMENGRADDAIELLAGAVEDAERAGSRLDAIRIRLQQLALFVYTDVTVDEIREGVDEGRELLEELEALGDDTGLAQGWVVVDYLHWLVGEMANAEDASGRSVAHAQRAGRLRERVAGGGDQATSLCLGPLPVAQVRALAEERSRSPDPVVAAGGEMGVAATAALAGDAAGSGEAEARWRHLVETHGLEWLGAYHAVTGLAPVLLEAGEADRTETLLREGLDTMERLGDVWLLNSSGWLLPLVLLRQGRDDEAAVLADALEERYREMEVLGSVLRGVALSGTRAVRGREDEALTIAIETAGIARASDSNLCRSLALEELAGLLHPTDPSAAIGTLEEVAELDAAWGNVVGSERVARRVDAWRAALS
jgi:class 3 adenylate cyclase